MLKTNMLIWETKRKPECQEQKVGIEGPKDETGGGGRGEHTDVSGYGKDHYYFPYFILSIWEAIIRGQQRVVSEVHTLEVSPRVFRGLWTVKVEETDALDWGTWLRQ